MGVTSASLSCDRVVAASVPAVPASGPARLGAPLSGDAGPAEHWLLRRNCSATPRQVLGLYLSVCILSSVLAIGFWVMGAALVAPFAGLEMLAVGAALWVYARHATDHERIVLQSGRLTVERVDAGHVRRVEFAPDAVHVDAEALGRRTIGLSCRGRRVTVGRFLRAEQRRMLARELRAALVQRRAGESLPSAQTETAWRERAPLTS